MFFKKKYKDIQKIEIDGVVYELAPGEQFWTFSYKNKDFVLYNKALEAFTLKELNSVSESFIELESNMTEIVCAKTDLKEQEFDWLIDLTDYKNGIIEFVCSSKNEFNDIGVSFKVNNGIIEDVNVAD